jgi:hypothetical protein
MKITKETKRDSITIWVAEVETSAVRALSDTDLALLVEEALDQVSYRTGKNKKALADIDAAGKVVKLEDILAILRASGDKNKGPSKADVAGAKEWQMKCWTASAPLVDMAKRNAHCRAMADRKDTANATAHTGGKFWDVGCGWDLVTLSEMFRHHRVSLDRDLRRKQAALKALDGEDLSPPTAPPAAPEAEEEEDIADEIDEEAADEQ